MLLDDKTILITGGTGSFGKCFTKYVLTHLTSFMVFPPVVLRYAFSVHFRIIYSAI